jgi:hypothetical protein
MKLDLLETENKNWFDIQTWNKSYFTSNYKFRARTSSRGKRYFILTLLSQNLTRQELRPCLLRLKINRLVLIIIYMELI